MLSNAYFLAKIRFDTAENEPAQNLQNFAKTITKFANLQILLTHEGHPHPHPNSEADLAVQSDRCRELADLLEAEQQVPLCCLGGQN